MKRPEGFAAFGVIWLGQIVSAVGTRMTAFALGLWLWQQTGSVLQLSMLAFCSFGATILVSPVAGALVDRWNRRLTINLSDLGAVVATGGLLLAFLTSAAHTWELYVVSALTGTFLAFQFPAYASTITQMVQRGHYPRANAMMSMVRTIPGVAAPALAATLLTLVDIKAILLIDTLSYLVAIGTVFLVALPPSPAKEAGTAPAGMWQDSLFGFRYIARRPPLVATLGLSFVVGLVAAVTYAVMLPLVLAMTGDSAAKAGIVQSVGAAGGVLGGLLVAALGGRRDPMRYVLLSVICLGVFGRTLFGLGDNVLVWSFSLLVGWGVIPVIDGYIQSIWQETVEPEVQGRVFAAQQFVENLSLPVALIGSGLLADHVFEPAMRPGGALAGAFGGLVGTGPGSGMALMCVFGGGILLLIGLAGFALPLVRHPEAGVSGHETSELESATAG